MNAVCVDTLIDQISHEITHRGDNRSKYPFSMAFVDGHWEVTIEVNSVFGTFDIVTEGDSRVQALKNALGQLRRELARGTAS